MNEPILIKTYDAEAAISAYRIVQFGTAAKQVKKATAETDQLIGVLGSIGVDADERVDVIRAGFAEVEYGGVVTKGDLLTSDSVGRAVKLTDVMLESGARFSIGVAEETGTTSDIGSMLIQPQKVSKFDAVTASAAEINQIDGSVVGNTAASKAAMLDALKKLRTNANVGTAGTGVTAVEIGDGHHHTSVLTINTTLPAIAGGANLAVGNLIYTLPAGACIINAAYMSLGITQSQGNINADTPDGGLGTVMASGIVAVLDGTATFENILTGQTFNNCTGTAEVKTANPTAAVPFIIAAGDAHTVHFNVADGWAASGDAAAVLAGTVVLFWDFMA
jgi:hypothetical protein